MNKLMLLTISFLLSACIQVRPDGAPSPMDTQKHAMAFFGCGKASKGALGCYVEADTTDLLVNIPLPLPGTLRVISSGCSQDQLIAVVDSAKEYQLSLAPFIANLNKACQITITYMPDPKFLDQALPVRGMRGIVYIVRRDAPKIEAPDQFPVHFVVENAVNFPKLEFSTTPPSVLSVFGCGYGITNMEITNPRPAISIEEILPQDYTVRNSCLLKGDLVDVDGPHQFGLGLLVYKANDLSLQNAVFKNDTDFCYQAEPTVSFVTYQNKITSTLKKCFKPIEGDVLSFYTIVGRTQYFKFQNGSFKEVK